MKRTKRLAIVTMVAIVVLSLSMVTTAFAAPATCPLKGAAAAPAKTCPKTDISKVLGTNANLADILSKCQNTDAMKQLFDKLCATNTDCTKGACENNACKNDCAAGNCQSGVCMTECANGNCMTKECGGVNDLTKNVNGKSCPTSNSLFGNLQTLPCQR